MKKAKTPREKLNNFWVMLTLISCFFPLAIPLAFIAARLENRYTDGGNPTILHCGVGACCFFFLMAIIPITTMIEKNWNSGIAVLTVYYSATLVLALCLFAVYAFYRRRNMRYQKCLLLIRQEHITSLPKLGEIMGLSSNQLEALLKDMMRRGLLPDASIPEGSDELLFARSIWARQHVICQHCGAALTVNLGEALVCPYCGGALKARRIRETAG